ncbi:hypothetical protein M885DRAFT_16639 [Pelagophyceae sp. CCMP2097]|nr:hypothetical protein M885DRAFT_16639 [Pelagophyceae sp. CCMP2097]
MAKWLGRRVCPKCRLGCPMAETVARPCWNHGAGFGSMPFLNVPCAGLFSGPSLEAALQIPCRARCLDHLQGDSQSLQKAKKQRALLRRAATPHFQSGGSHKSRKMPKYWGPEGSSNSAPKGNLWPPRASPRRLLDGAQALARRPSPRKAPKCGPLALGGCSCTAPCSCRLQRVLRYGIWSSGPLRENLMVFVSNGGSKRRFEQRRLLLRPLDNAPRNGPSIMPLDNAPRNGPSKRPLETAPRYGPSKRPLETAPRNGASKRPLETAPRNGPSKRPLETAPRNGPSKRPLETAPRNGPSMRLFAKRASFGPTLAFFKSIFLPPLEMGRCNALCRHLSTAPCCGLCQRPSRRLKGVHVLSSGLFNGSQVGASGRA